MPERVQESALGRMASTALEKAGLLARMVRMPKSRRARQNNGAHRCFR